MITKFCPACEAVMPVEPLKEITVSVRGEEIAVPLPDSYICLKCGEFIIPHDFDELDYAYRVYREKHGMLQPEELKKMVESIGVERISEMLDVKKETILRYINGGLQDELHDEIIQLLYNQNGETVLDVKKMYKVNPTALIDYLLLNGERVVLDFAHVKGITHSFANELVGQFVEKYGIYILKSGMLTAVNYNGETREILNWVVDLNLKYKKSH